MTISSPRAGARGLAVRLYAYAFLDDLILLYPFYALLFAQTLSTAQISSLFVVWAVTGTVAQLPSGALADAVSRRALLVAAPLVTGAGYALWTFTPSYPMFAAGFVLWGLGSALRDGALEALIYEELERVGAVDRYAHLMGRARALLAVAAMAATAVAAPVMAVGGFTAVGAASVAACLLGAAAAVAFPEHRTRPAGWSGAGYREHLAMLRRGVGQVRHRRPVRYAVLVLVAVVTLPGVLEEYVPLLAAGTGVAGTAVPLLVLLVSAGAAAGGLLGGVAARLRGRGSAALVVAAAAAVGGGALVGHWLGFLVVAAGFAGFQMAAVAADARLQREITGPARATVTSLAGLGEEVATVGCFALYGVVASGSGHPVAFAAFAAPYLLAAWWPVGRRATGRPRPAGRTVARVPRAT